ncbi:MAG: hypothetical protein KC466_03900, partial [Myxococcales bacterium]|nr:hypothetical protein [Myxococcales bacterium]
PSLVTTAWTNASAGSGAAFFVNLDPVNPLAVDATIDLTRWGLPAGGYLAQRVTLAGVAPLPPANAPTPYALSTTIGPREIVMVEFTPSP